MSAERRNLVGAELPPLEIDALLVSGIVNVRYLTGFTGSNALLLVSPRESVLFTDPRYTIRSSREVDCTVVIAKGSLNDAAAKMIRKRRWKRIAVEQNRMVYGAVQELEKALGTGIKLGAAPGLVERHRMVKSPEEIASIRRSVHINSLAFDKAVTRLKGNWTENDLSAELEYQMRKAGASRAAFETIVAAGPRSALPHASPTAEPVGADRLLLIDMGAVQNGYCSDMTRMLHIGKPGAKARRLYKAVLEAQLAAIDAVKENVTAGAVDSKAREVLKIHGYGDLFVHSTGHGLGLEIHEPPRLGKRDKTRLKAGMAITIEPGAYIEGFGGVRIEDTIVVTRNGCEVLTPTDKELRIV